MLFKGTFNWYCELFILYSQAKNENKAFNNFIIQLASKLNTSRRNIYLYFSNGRKDKFKIKEVKDDESR